MFCTTQDELDNFWLFKLINTKAEKCSPLESENLKGPMFKKQTKNTHTQTFIVLTFIIFTKLRVNGRVFQSVNKSFTTNWKFLKFGTLVHFARAAAFFPTPVDCLCFKKKSSKQYIHCCSYRKMQCRSCCLSILRVDSEVSPCKGQPRPSVVMVNNDGPKPIFATAAQEQMAQKCH